MFSRDKMTKPTNQDWATSTADTIERVIDSVRAIAVDRVTTVARAIVYGALALIVGVPALVLLAILLVRMLHIYLANIPGATSEVWLADFVVGTIFVLAGLFLWAKRAPKHSDQRN